VSGARGTPEFLRRSIRLTRFSSILWMVLLSATAGVAAASDPESDSLQCAATESAARDPLTSPWVRVRSLRSDPEPSAGETAAVAPAPPPAPVAPPPPRRFWIATAEVAALELIPWAFDRYVTDLEWARISTDTVKENFETGFEYDHDDFPVNQFGHPYHGSTFFNAARSNGYGYWGSGVFTLAGSLAWECCMENTPPSTNDLVNTTLGGMTRGEVAHRLSAMILDNTASGGERFWRELGAALVNPVGAFNRLVRGDMNRHFDNPEERFPQGFSAAADVGYRQVTADDFSASQASLSLSARYGDPFAGDFVKPFDTFWAEMDLNTPGGTTLTRLEERGLLKGWDWSAGGSTSRHIFGFTQEYSYINNEAEVFGAQMFAAGLYSRFGSGDRVFASTELSAIVIPLAGIKTIDFVDPEAERTYDYAPGGGLRVGAKLLNARGLELASLGYSQIRAYTVDGVSDESRLQFFRGSARVPLSRRFGVGAGYWWYGRKTTYADFTEPRRTQSEWRAFFNITVGASGMRKPTT
jgi:hypothetical protein